MLGTAESAGSDLLAERVDPASVVERARIRLRTASIAANVAGAIVVFLFGWIVLPAPSHVSHSGRLLALNAVVFVLIGAAGVAIGWWRLSRIWRTRLAWAMAGREPSDEERETTLRFPLVQQRVIGQLWLVAAAVFAALNAPFSGELAANVAMEIVLGGLVTCSLGYLLAERQLRPITALCLRSGVPEHPQLPGVAARALLSWTLATGAVLLGLVLVAIGGLHEQRFTAERLSVAMLVLSAIGIAVGLVSMLGLARSLADPIEKLRHAVGGVERGELDHEVPVDDGSEVGLLQAGFNRMLAGLRERERIRDLFGRQPDDAAAAQ